MLRQHLNYWMGRGTLIKLFALGAVLAAAFVSNATASFAATISAETVFYFRGIQGPTSARPVNVSETVDTLTIAVDGVDPDGYSGTTVVASQGDTTIDVPFSPVTQQPQRFATSINYDAALAGSWEITLTNEDDELVLTTPDIGSVDTPAEVTGVKLVGGEVTSPQLEWDQIGEVDDIQIVVLDLTNRLPDDSVDILRTFSAGSAATQFQIPEGVLTEGGLYAIGIMSVIEYSESETSGFDVPVASLKTTRTTYFEFAATETAVPVDWYLPQVTNVDGNPVFNFNNSVVANLVEYYDPMVAIGYDYEIGANDPYFASVILPEIGDSMFDILLPTDNGFEYFASAFAGEEFFFGSEGVSAFRVLGIETASGLDPSDPTAFVTGLSFVSDGRFTGTMTPISVDVSEVPLPATLPYMLAGTLSLGLLSKSRRKAA